jgi:arylsulfatase A-like enzyme
MNRVSRGLVVLKALAAASVFVGLILPLGCSSKEGISRKEAPSRPHERPNVVLVIVDDLDAGSVSRMPKVKSLLTEGGTTFENYFVTHPLCCPSRASILRGQYSHNHRVLTNEPSRGAFDKFYEYGLEDSTVATWLDDAGYRTALIGEYLNNYPGDAEPTHVPPGWDEWYGRASEKSYYDYDLNENGKLVSYGNAPEDYQTDVLARKAKDFVRHAAAEEEPFFAYVATGAVHSPVQPAPRHQETSVPAQAPRLPSFDEEDVSDKPSWVRAQPRLTPQRVSQTDGEYRNRLRALLAVDEMVSGLVEELRASGELENTYVVLTSDNGYQLGEHRLAQGKRTAYEESIRVPLIVRGPGVPSGKAVRQLALNIDLAPTFAELGGADTPDFVDGRSLGPFLRGTPPKDWRTALLVEHTGGGLKGFARDVPSYEALRTEDHKYVEYETGEREIYDLRTDPNEMKSLQEGADPALVARMQERLAALQRCSGPDCRSAEDDGP